MVDQLSSFAAEVTRVANEVGTEGKLGGQAQVEGVSGTWRGLTENVNLMADNLTAQVRSIADVTTAVAKGDLSQKITIETKGEIAQLASTINTMVDQLSELRRRGDARRARGRHRGEARRPGDGRRRLRHLARADGQRQSAREQPHRPGARDRRRHDRGREGRPLPEDHGRREGRDRRAEGHDQHDGRPALGVRRRGHARRARGRHRGQARRRGRGRGRLRRLARPDREREHDGELADRAGAQHRRGDDRGRERRPLEEDHRRREGRDRGAEGDDQHDGRPALERSPPR